MRFQVARYSLAHRVSSPVNWTQVVAVTQQSRRILGIDDNSICPGPQQQSVLIHLHEKNKSSLRVCVA